MFLPSPILFEEKGLCSFHQNHYIFRYLQNRTRVVVWLYENVNTRIEGQIVGFDEYMNLVLDDASECHMKRHTEKKLGRIMLKGDNITLIQSKEGISKQ